MDKISLNTKYVNGHGEVCEIAEIEINNNVIKLTYIYDGREEKCVLYAEDFFKYFKLVEENESHEMNNVNQDIIKLIESGYEFKSFYGTTINSKDINVELND